MALNLFFTADIWELTSLDIAGTDWSPTTLHFTSQEPRPEGGVTLEGFFEWRDEFDRWGRETFVAELTPNGTFRTLSTELTGPTLGIISANYTARLSADGQTLLDGQWDEGTDGDFTARIEVLDHDRSLYHLEAATGLPREGAILSLAGVSVEGSELNVARTGGDAFAFQSVFGNDSLRPDRAEEVGEVFLTHGANSALTLRFEAASEVSGALLDVDGREAWQIRALDATGGIVDQTTIQAGGPFTGDGMVSYWLLQTETGENAITSLRFEPLGTGDPLAFDRLMIERSGVATPIRVEGGAAGETLSGGAGQDTLLGRGGDDVLRGLAGEDRLLGQSGRDTVFGGAGADTLKGGGGVDRLVGGQGRDRLSGDGANDRLLGGNGNDTLLGGGGRDLLDGGAGRDRMVGGAGGDTFVFDGRGNDVVTDFVPGEDVLRLAGAAEVASFRAFLRSAQDVDGDLHVTTDNGTLRLLGLSERDLSPEDLGFA